MTPSRFACESRPLRDDPPAFLCAIFFPQLKSRRPSQRADPMQLRDRIDSDLGEVLTMPGVLLKMLAPLHLEYLDFLVTPVRQDGGYDRCSTDQRRANAQLGALADGQDFRQGNLLSNLVRQRFHFDTIARVHPILLAARLDHREHRHILTNRGHRSPTESFELSQFPQARVNRVVFRPPIPR
ncbi:hypothetical protein SBBP2_20014 [Burkholderiales bacterium]|nr:hypothetical protein SBBP2_20014 [Burkholderiales bacterium]